MCIRDSYYPLPASGRGDGSVVLRSADSGTDADGGLTLDKVRLVETRLLVRRASGWLALPYVWNAEQTEARLMRSGEPVSYTHLRAPEQPSAGSPPRPALVSSPQIPATPCMSSSQHPGAADEWLGRAWPEPIGPIPSP